MSCFQLPLHVRRVQFGTSLDIETSFVVIKPGKGDGVELVQVFCILLLTLQNFYQVLLGLIPQRLSFLQSVSDILCTLLDVHLLQQLVSLLQIATFNSEGYLSFPLVQFVIVHQGIVVSQTFDQLLYLPEAILQLLQLLAILFRSYLVAAELLLQTGQVRLITFLHRCIDMVLYLLLVLLVVASRQHNQRQGDLV